MLVNHRLAVGATPATVYLLDHMQVPGHAWAYPAVRRANQWVARHHRYQRPEIHQPTLPPGGLKLPEPGQFRPMTRNSEEGLFGA
jgi:hypothetical protein